MHFPMSIHFALALGAVVVNGYTLPTLPPQQHAPINIKMALDLAALGVDGTPLAKTVKGFQLVPDQKLRYQQLLFLAKKLPDMDPSLLVEENRVPGCLSVVHVHATQNDAGEITFQGSSDAQLTKGLVALLVNGLSGCTNEQIQRVQAEFIQECGLAQSLTPGRNNGFLNMLAMMKRKAAAVGGDSGDSGDGEPVAAAAAPAAPAPPPAARAPPPSMLAAGSLGPVGTRIAANLESEFSPSMLDLVDESDQHAGHAGAKGLDGESHFALTIVSDAFEGIRSLKRHQMVYAAIGDEMPKIHALSINARAPGEEIKVM